MQIRFVLALHTALTRCVIGAHGYISLGGICSPPSNYIEQAIQIRLLRRNALYANDSLTGIYILPSTTNLYLLSANWEHLWPLSVALLAFVLEEVYTIVSRSTDDSKIHHSNSANCGEAIRTIDSNQPFIKRERDRLDTADSSDE